MLDLIELTKIYDRRKPPAANNISLSVGTGEIFGFIGPNGAGKTTVIKMITGILEPTSGSVTLGGINVDRDPIGYKMQFGYVPDNPDIYERLTGMEYLNFMADVYSVGNRERKERIEKYTGMFEISSALGNSIKSYSHGMKQKLVLTGALIHEPVLWILDEPLVGLDPMSAHLLKEEMKEHAKRGNTVFFSTHVLEVAEKLCTSVGIINKGVLVAAGSVDDIKRKAGAGDRSLEDAFINIIEKK